MAEQLKDTITANCQDINKVNLDQQLYYYPDVEDWYTVWFNLALRQATTFIRGTRCQ